MFKVGSPDLGDKRAAFLIQSSVPFVTQVQLLVSNSDVENYKQIKSDLDELRLLVEKSELWVYKSKKDLPTEARARKVTPGLTGLRKDGGSGKEPEKRKDSLEQQDLEVVSVSTSQVKKSCNISLIPQLFISLFCQEQA